MYKNETDLLGSELRPPSRRRGRQALAAVYALVGGSIAGVLLFTLSSFWALVIGLAAMVALGAMTARRSEVPGAVGIMIAYTFAFALLTWPVLLLIAGGLWGTWE
jgi:Ca2+/H+ antiporter